MQKISTSNKPQEWAESIINTLASPRSEAKLMINKGEISIILSSRKGGEEIELIPKTSDNVEIFVDGTLRGTAARTEISREVAGKLGEGGTKIPGKIKNSLMENENLLVTMVKLMILLQKR